MSGRVAFTFKDFVHRANTWSEQRPMPRKYLRYLEDEQHVRQLLAAVDDGLELTPYAVGELANEYGVMSTLGAEYFRANPWFDDDTRFTSTRFAFMFRYHRAAYDEHEEVMTAAGAQLDRMFAVGRVSPDFEYLMKYTNQVFARVNAGGDPLMQVPLAAHFDNVREVFALRVRDAEEFGGVYAAAPKGTLAQVGYEAQQVLTVVDAQRDELFRERWLRSALSEAEWLGACELVIPVLKELYADVWSAGYAGYHARGQAAAAR